MAFRDLMRGMGRRTGRPKLVRVEMSKTALTGKDTPGCEDGQSYRKKGGPSFPPGGRNWAVGQNLSKSRWGYYRSLEMPWMKPERTTDRGESHQKKENGRFGPRLSKRKGQDLKNQLPAPSKETGDPRKFIDQREDKQPHQ